MTKKVLALLLAALMIVAVMAGCTTTEEVWVSVSGEDTGVAGNNGDENNEDENNGDENNEEGNNQGEENNDGEENNGNDGNGSSDKSQNSGKTTSRRIKTTTGKATTHATGKKTRPTRAEGEGLNFTPVADAGANYNVSGTVSIAVDTVRPTDYDAMFDILQQLYPKISFVFDYWSHSTNDDGREYLTSRMATKSAANIMWDEAGEIPTYIMNGGWIKPITDYVAKDPEAKYIPANIKEDYTYFGELFAVPHQATFETVAFNTKLQKELGIKDSDMPGLEWSLAEYEALLKKGAAGFNKGKCVAIQDLFEAYNRVTFINSNATGKKYGVRAYNYATGQCDVNYLKEGALQFREWREIAGVEGWYQTIQKNKAGQSLLQQQLGQSSYSSLWGAGKAFMEDTLTVYTEKWDEQYPDLEWIQWTAPNKDGNLMMHIDHCFITSTTPEKDMEACYQALRFMTFSTNGNLARLTMYEDSQKGKYNLNSHVYHLTTTSKVAIDKFNKLSCTDEVDEYLVANIPNSSRYDTFKFVPGSRMADAEWGNALNDITDGLDKGEGLNEPVKDVNATYKEYEKQLETDFKKYYK